MDFFEFLKTVLIGIVEGITEWLPISSTGHMILLNEFIKLNVSDEFMELFIVMIQVGAIFAVIFFFFKKIWPFGWKKSNEEAKDGESNNDSNITEQNKSSLIVKKDILMMWIKVLIACIPAGIIGILFDDKIDELFYNPWVVASTLIIYGVLFIIIETLNKKRNLSVSDLNGLTYKMVVIIGLAQLLALIPGTSRSGVTILAAMLLGCTRTLSAEFTFFLSIPIMLGAGLVKLLKFGFVFSSTEITCMLIGLIVAFVVSLFVIKFLMSFIKKYDFKVFGWYRIVLGIIVLLFFL